MVKSFKQSTSFEGFFLNEHKILVFLIDLFGHREHTCIEPKPNRIPTNKCKQSKKNDFIFLFLQNLLVNIYQE